MKLTPGERVKLNAAIVNSVKTGQPLSSNLQTLYDRAAQVESLKQAQPKALLSPGFPVGKTPLVTRDFDLTTNKEGPLKVVYPQGPASDLPVTKFEDLYPRTVPVESDDYRLPFNREFDFTKAPVNIQDTESVRERSQRFLNQYFPGKNPGTVINPVTNTPYGNELKIHDAMHDFANVGNTLRGEELITIAENVGASPLAGKNVGLEDLTQQITLGDKPPDIEYDNALRDARGMARMGGPTLVQQRGAQRGSSLFRDRNQVASFLSPPISQEEFNTMAQRGQEFYDQVHQNWDAFKRGGSVEWSDAPTWEGRVKRNNAVDEFLGNNGGSMYAPPKAITQRIAGGYNKGGIPYGNPISLMNAPLAPTVDSNLWQQSLNKLLKPGPSALQNTITKEQQAYMAPEAVAAREAPKIWDQKADALKDAVSKTEYEFGFQPESPEMERNIRVYNALIDAQGTRGGRTTRGILEDVLGERPNESLRYDQYRTLTPVTMGINRLSGQYIDQREDFFTPLMNKEVQEEAIKKSIESVRGYNDRGLSAGVLVQPGENRIYLNPPNLGSNVIAKNNIDINAANVFKGAGINAEDVLLEAAAKAKQIEGYNKALPKVKQAIRTGFNTATDLTGSVPLFDPVFRQAIEQGNMGEAARRVGAEYATGLAAAPVVGLGMGALSRVSPRAAALATGALGTARVANPIAVVSQLGGSAKPTPAAAAAEQVAGKAQLLRAEAARKRGGKWSFPTPFGRVTIPELGLSEAGGLFFR